MKIATRILAVMGCKLLNYVEKRGVVPFRSEEAARRSENEGRYLPSAHSRAMIPVMCFRNASAKERKGKFYPTPPSKKGDHKGMPLRPNTYRLLLILESELFPPFLREVELDAFFRLGVGFSSLAHKTDRN